MPVNSLHPEYAAYQSKWTRCRDTFEGSDAVKERGVSYLPALTEQTAAEYDAYKTRAVFYSITSKTLESLVGIALQKEPVLVFPDRLQPYFKDNGGVEFFELLSKSFSEVMLMGRFGVLIDRAEGEGGLAVPVPYVCESILNWEIDSTGRFTFVVLHESILETTATDRFVKTYKNQYRVLELVDGFYQQTVYDDKLAITKTFNPTNSGVKMGFIPFYICTPAGINSAMAKPPLLDIADINLSHYRSSADLEHGRHFTGLPTPVAIGVDASSTLKVGSMTAWIIPNASGDAKYLEFTGEGLKSLEKALSEKQSQLASLSARLIDSSTRGSESPDTIKMRYASENANLVAISRAVEAFLNTVYNTIVFMESITGKVEIVLNKDFLDKTLTSKEVKEFIESYFEGGISKETLIFNLRKGGVLSPNRSDEDEMASIKSNINQGAGNEA